MPLRLSGVNPMKVSSFCAPCKAKRFYEVTCLSTKDEGKRKRTMAAVLASIRKAMEEKDCPSFAGTKESSKPFGVTTSTALPRNCRHLIRRRSSYNRIVCRMSFHCPSCRQAPCRQLVKVPSLEAQTMFQVLSAIRGEDDLAAGCSTCGVFSIRRRENIRHAPWWRTRPDKCGRSIESIDPGTASQDS